MKRICFLMMIALTGCTQVKLSPVAYMQWAREPDHGLCQIKQLGNYEFTVQYRSPEMLACEYYGAGCSEKQIDSIRRETTNTMFFTFRFKSDHAVVNPSGHYETPEYLDYLIGGVENDLMLLVGGDTIYPSSCHYERNYGLSPYHLVNLVFDTKGEKNEKVVFLFNDQILQTGPIRFVYEAGAFNDLPQIEL